MRFLSGLALAVLLLLSALLLEDRVRPGVVVLMFHRTPDFGPASRWLELHGWRCLSYQEFQQVVRGQLTPPRKSVLLTFDDGDLTHWTVASAELERRGQCGLFFCIVDRTGSGAPRSRGPQGVLPSADDWAARHPGMPDPWSLRWSEARAMERSGHATLAAHSATHAWSFYSDSLLGLDAGPNWKTVSAHGGWDGQGARLPRYPGRSALLGPAFVPDSSRRAQLAGLPHAPGRFESSAQWEARLDHELRGARERLADSLGGSRHTLAWPWGANSPELRRRARAVGYTWIFGTRPGLAGAGSDSLDLPRVDAHPDARSLSTLLFLYRRPMLGRIYSWLHPQ